jgi:hypothetical protein
MWVLEVRTTYSTHKLRVLITKILFLSTCYIMCLVCNCMREELVELVTPDGSYRYEVKG